MAGGENLEAFITFKADNGSLQSTINTSVASINKINPAANKAEASIKQIWNAKSGASGLNSTISQTSKELEGVANQAKKTEGGIKGALASLKQSGGKRSALGESLELLHGGGAVMAVSMLGEGLAKATESAVKFKEAYQSGQKTGIETAQGILEDIPIIGGFAKAGHAINELITGEEALAKNLRDEIKLQERLGEMRFKAAEGTMLSARGWRMNTQSLGEQQTVLEAPKGSYQQSVAGEQARYGSQSRGEQAKLEDQTRELKDAGEEQKKVAAEYWKTRFKEGSVELASKLKDVNRDIDNSIEVNIKQITAEAKKEQDALSKYHNTILDNLRTAKDILEAITDQTELIGKNDLDKFATELKQQGLPAEAVGNLLAAKGKQLGAGIHESNKTYMEHYQDEMNYLNKMQSEGYIGKQDYLKASANASRRVLSEVKTNSVEGAFMENLKSRFVEGGINSQIDDLNKQAKGGAGGNVQWDFFRGADDKGAGANGATADNTDAVKDATDMTKDLNDTMQKLVDQLSNGIIGTFG